ncbi:MAG: hypothetical protein BWZ10_02561 [candidate division BRC1 bacterium ADurb.BinA364]|nr:MAG: hypothetical protein BWZ10_02561 [candidate division BRC1 bacterium ADurb.BinA364]
MAPFVVDALEAVEIEHHRRDVSPMPRGAHQFAFEHRAQSAAIVHAGQFVIRGQRCQDRVLPFQALDQPRQAQLGFHSSQENRKVDRLGDIVVGPQIQRLDHALGVVQSGDHDHGNGFGFGIGAQRCKEIQAARIGHRQVQQQKVERAFLDFALGFPRAGGQRDVVAFVSQAPRQHLRVDRLVIDNQHAASALRLVHDSRSGAPPGRAA